MKLNGNQLEVSDDVSSCVLVRVSKIEFDSPYCEIELENSTTSDTDANPTEVAVAQNARHEVWRHPMDFLCSCIAMSIGLGNVWRFPLAAYENGGGAFIIAYIVVLFLIGVPLYALEMTLGQFASSGPIAIWNIARFFKGVGLAAMLGTFCAATYYASLMALTVYYAFVSVNSVLPWTECDVSWAPEAICTDGVFGANQSNLSLSESYYRNKVFQQWSHINEGIGQPYLHLVICLLVSWSLIYVSLIVGLKWSGKLAYVTSIFPSLVLLILTTLGLTLKGAQKGIEMFIHIEWAQLLEAKIWYASIAQCCFSLSTGSGPVIYLASYNKFHHNILRDAIIIGIMDTLISLLAGVAIFAIIGSIADELNVGVYEIFKSGLSIVFITYPHVIAKLEFAPQVLSVMMFLMVFALALGSVSAMVGGVIQSMLELFPLWRKGFVCAVVCTTGFLLGIIYITPGGEHIVKLVDHFGASFVIYIAVLLEVVAVCWVYGLNSFCRDAEFMLHRKVKFYWKICWSLLVPFGLIIALLHIFEVEDKAIRNSSALPSSAIVSGWLLSATCLILIPIFAIREIYLAKATTITEKLKEAIRRNCNWGPREPALRKRWKEYRSNLASRESNNEATASRGAHSV